jgi:hypothetical protein
MIPRNLESFNLRSLDSKKTRNSIVTLSYIDLKRFKRIIRRICEKSLVEILGPEPIDFFGDYSVL